MTISWTTLFVIVGLLFVLALVVRAVSARKQGRVKKENVLVQLADSLYVKVYTFFGGVVDATRDTVAAADIDIANANHELEKFTDEILNLREEIRLQKKELPRAAAEVEKWENIYLKAVKANDEKGKTEASRLLKNADTRLEGITNLLAENAEVLDQLEEQKKLLQDGLANAEVLKDRLAAQKTSAELRQKAHARGANAAAGLNILSELEEEVNRAEARAEALDEVKAEKTSLEDKYDVKVDEHSERLASLRNRLEA